MFFIINWLVIVITLYPLIKSIKRIMNVHFSILHIAVVVFWGMQVLPILIQEFGGLGQGMTYYEKMVTAMQDDLVSIVYDVLCVIIIYILYLFGNMYSRNRKLLSYINEFIANIKINKIVVALLCVGMFIVPFFAVLMSPSPDIYFSFSYFYTHTVSALSLTYIYHYSVMTIAVYVSLMCALVLYLFRKKKTINLDLYLCIALATWLSGKRALLIFALVGFIVIDIVKQQFSIKKSVMFGIIAISYFALYTVLTGKGADIGFVTNYYLYYSRMNSVKTAIYACLYNEQIVEYTGQTILFDLFFWIPRSIWTTKPFLFCKYFTAYSLGRTSTSFVGWNIHVNIWTEFFANFGIVVGTVLSLIIVIKIAKSVEKSTSFLLYSFGTAFIVFYFMFGFEMIVIAAYVGLIVSYIKVKFLSHLTLGGKK